MKTLHIVFTDEEFKTLKNAKKEVNWHDFILMIVEKYNGDEQTND